MTARKLTTVGLLFGTAALVAFVYVPDPALARLLAVLLAFVAVAYLVCAITEPTDPPPSTTSDDVYARRAHPSSTTSWSHPDQGVNL